MYWSSGSEKLYGWTSQQAVGSISHALLRTVFPEPLPSINTSLKARGDWSGNLLHRAKDGRAINVYSHWVLGQDDGRGERRVYEINVRAEGMQTRLASLVDSTNDAVIGETLDGTVTSWNASAERLFEYTAEEIVGRPVSMLFPPDLADEEMRLIDKIRGGDKVTHYEAVRVSKSGQSLVISLTLSPIYDFEGDLVGISKIARDITERRRNEEALKQANASLEEFAYVAAHDLQEPLRNISLALQQLELFGPKWSEVQKNQMMATAVRNSKRMESLIKDLLAFSRALDDSSSAGLSSDPNAAVAHARENLAQAIRENEATVVLDAPLPEAAMRYTHLLQLMQNLIGNSLKYRKPGVPPVIRIAARQEWSHVVFSVSDNGLGIAPAYHQRIFGVFKRLHHSMPGNGIGLAVCKRIVEHYAGTMWVDSAEGQGATFHFSVPSLIRKSVNATSMQH